MSYELLKVFAVHLCVPLSGGNPIIREGVKRAEDVRFAGTADGKTFFTVYNGTSLNWFEAGQACQQMNMKLAELATPAQVNAVKLSYDSGLIVSYAYWVGGRDAGVSRQFSWNSTNIDASLAGPGLIGFSITAPNTCLRYYPANSLFWYTTCTTKTSRRLCEISTSKLSELLP